MEFNSPNEQSIIKYLLPYFDKFKFNKQQLNIEKEKELFKIFSLLLEDIKDAYKYINSIKHTEIFKYKLNNINDVKSDLGNSRYFPEIIRNFIYNYGKQFLTYTCSFGSKTFNLHFMLFDDVDNLELCKYDEYAYLVFTWLFICNKYSNSNCNNLLNIYIYLTPFKKTMPETMNDILSSDHINSAYTYACIENGELVVFREEEWFKVFIHETIHSFGFDYTLLNDRDIINHVKKLFPIKSEFSIADAYTETMARIINSAIYAFNIVKNDNSHKFCKLGGKKKLNTTKSKKRKSKKDKKLINKKFNKKEYYLYINFLLNIERHYALHQLDNILKFLDLNYQDLYLNTPESKMLRDTLYREKTHVFAYYILSCVLLNNYKDFCIFANKDNNFYKFNSSLKNKNDFLKLIDENYKSPILLEDLRLLQKYKKKPRYEKYKNLEKDLRMSVIQI